MSFAKRNQNVKKHRLPPCMSFPHPSRIHLQSPFLLRPPCDLPLLSDRTKILLVFPSFSSLSLPRPEKPQKLLLLRLSPSSPLFPKQGQVGSFELEKSNFPLPFSPPSVQGEKAIRVSLPAPTPLVRTVLAGDTFLKESYV